MSSLKAYRTKRVFSETPEPKGKVKKSKNQLTFVIHKHAATRLHYDLRLELDGVLKSWAVPKGPSLNPKDKRLAIMVEDHPYDYKDFEGIIPSGYGAGTVMIWDEGTYHAVNETDRTKSEKILRAGLEKGHFDFVLDGKKLKGEFALVKMKGKEKEWLLIKKGDSFASENDIALSDKSATTKRSMEEIKEGKKKSNSIPHSIKPMLATLVAKPFDESGWLFEIKWDGFRAIAEVENGKVNLYSRNLLSFNKQFEAIVEELKKIEDTVILDGEIVVLDKDGKPSFQLLQNYQRTGEGNLIYYVFDLLYADGQNLIEEPLLERKNKLKKVLPKLNLVKISDHIVEKGIEFFKAAEKQGLEGIMAKDSASPYRQGKRTKEWLKIKTHARQEAIICGFTKPRGSRKHFGSVILGVYDETGNLKYVGHVGGGFDTQMLSDLYAKLEKLVVEKSPFKKPPKTNMPVTWVKPKLICEVSFAEWTSDSQMRQPIFMGLRADKKVGEVKKENPESTDFTHLDKVFWPEEKYTKGDVINYYEEMAPIILPYLKDRPESLHRHPNGINGKSFFHKDVTEIAPSWSETVSIPHEGKKVNYLVIQDKKSLLFAAQLGCIELHPFHSRVQSLDKPDYAIIDLDPHEIAFEYVIETAKVVHQVLEEIGADHYCKTSGATGLHIYIPLGAKYTYEQAKQFAQLICTIVHHRIPSFTSLERLPKARVKKVYLDYLQNNPGQTIAAVYSIRPRAGAPVSTPIKWTELKKGLDPLDFNIKNIQARIKKVGDLFKPILGKGIDMEKCLKKIES